MPRQQIAAQAARRPLPHRRRAALREGRIAAIRGSSARRRDGTAGRAGALSWPPRRCRSAAERTDAAGPCRPAGAAGPRAVGGGGRGVAIVATSVGGTPEIFPPDSAAARLVRSDDAHALSAAISNVLCDPHLRGRLSDAARRRAEQQYDVFAAARNLMQHYAAVLEFARRG